MIEVGPRSRDGHLGAKLVPPRAETRRFRHVFCPHLGLLYPAQMILTNPGWPCSSTAEDRSAKADVFAIFRVNYTNATEPKPSSGEPKANGQRVDHCRNGG